MKNLLLPLVATTCLSLTASATNYGFKVNLDGPSESPANSSAGVGSGSAVWDDAAHTLQLDVVFSGLSGNVTASHIHAPTAVAGVSTAGVATTTPSFAGFPTGVTSGSYSKLLDLTQASSFNAAFINANGGTVASAETALITAMATGKAYWNIHSTTFGGGEIRGFFVAVPEPSSLAILSMGAVGGLMLARRKKVA